MGMIDVRRRVMLAGMFSEQTAQGNPLKFTTNLAKPLKSLVVPFTPILHGSGDPSPNNIRNIIGWNGVNGVRCGKNLFDASATPALIDCFGTSGAAIQRKGYELRLPPGDYIICPSNSTGNAYIYANVINSDGTLSGSTKQPVQGTNLQNATFTLQTGQYLTVYDAQADTAGSTVKFDKVDIMIATGSTAVTFEQYTGLPISCVFPAVGKNLFNKYATNTSNGYQNNKHLIPNGNTWDSNDYSVSEYIPVSGNTSYTISPVTGGWPAICFYDSDKVHISGEKYDSRSTVTVISPANAVYARVSIPKGNIDTLQLEKGSSATAYETFTNTVYGGTVDVVSGVGQIEWVSKDMGTIEWSLYNNNTNRQAWRRTLSDSKQCISSERSTALCSTLKTVKYDDSWTPYIIAQFMNDFYITFTSSEYASGSEVQEALSGEQLVYELATPIPFTCDPSTIQTLVGQNTIWTDTNGTNTAVYLKR